MGGGHAGCEAAAAAAKLGSCVLLISMDLNKLAQMSCNPAIGGIGKGQIVREIDALGGLTGVVTDLTTIHFRQLNRSKGAAMWSPRAQCDRMLFSSAWRQQLENIPNLWLFQDVVKQLTFNQNNTCVTGLTTLNGFHFKARAVILANGTFLNGRIFIGTTEYPGGRIGEPFSDGLTEQLKSIGFEADRMKTGTPVRIDGRSVDLARLPQQISEEGGKFSFDYSMRANLPKRPCYILHTSSAVHQILKTGFSASPLFNGQITGIGPRYCPSIETKIEMFPQKDSHQLFLEPEGVTTNEMYLNGFSSSLPWKVQYEALRQIQGLENALIIRPGYAIEYDFFPPVQLKHTLETKAVANLYFVGQINGTTGYEEAAGQGLVAGINAHRSINGLEPFTLHRDQAYIGVMIDDLVTKGVDEPYRMFTSRAEFRILMRQDNADERLTPLGFKLGLIDNQRFTAFEQKYQQLSSASAQLHRTSVEPNVVNPYLVELGSAPIVQKRKLTDLLIRPEISLIDYNHCFPTLTFDDGRFQHSSDMLLQVETMIKYQGYLEKERLNAQKLKRLEYLSIPVDFDFNSLVSLSTEARQKLTRIRPTSIGQAQRIPGISPNDISVLLVHFGR